MNNSAKKITEYTRKQGSRNENLRKQQKQIYMISDIGIIRYKI